ncbi:MAG: N-acetylglucosamine-6-phosphate deacetylase [Paracoccaceae bacterium]|nr:N-acetylglucosamine-6-phosphate deacetylase [Paracoccaceae bacterium]
MTDCWIAPDSLFDGQDIVYGQAVRIVDGRITEIAKTPVSAVRIKGCMTPGFVDLQVNGGGGVMLNTTPTRGGMADIAAAHRIFGTVAVMPTVITDHWSVLDQAAEAAIAAKGDDGIIGLHIEGPHISVARRGTHSAIHVRPMDNRTLDAVAALRHHDIAVMITIAPEATTLDQIAALVLMGAVVSIGHTDATCKDTEAAISAGASCATHLFNAMSPMVGRAPGAVGAVINSHVWSGIICDGVHVDDRMIKLALRARPDDNLMFLVSDAMATVGGPAVFDLYGQNIYLENGRLINVEGHLAGAHVTQAEGVARLVHEIDVSLAQALRMAISVPALVVRQANLAQMIGRLVRDVLVLSDDLKVDGTLGQILSAKAVHGAAK